MDQHQPLPPKFPLRFFRWYCHSKLVERIEGYLLEEYGDRVKKLGKRKADLRFIKDIMLLFRPGIIRPVEGYKNLNTYDMYKSFGGDHRMEYHFSRLSLISAI